MVNLNIKLPHSMTGLFDNFNALLNDLQNRNLKIEFMEVLGEVFKIIINKCGPLILENVIPNILNKVIPVILEKYIPPIIEDYFPPIIKDEIPKLILSNNEACSSNRNKITTQNQLIIDYVNLAHPKFNATQYAISNGSCPVCGFLKPKSITGSSGRKKNPLMRITTYKCKNCGADLKKVNVFAFNGNPKS